MTFKICELVEVDVVRIPEIADVNGNIIQAAVTRKEFVKRERDATPEEESEIIARQNASISPELFNADIDRKIASLETKQARPLRDILAAQLAGRPVDPADQATLIDIKTKIDALRAQRM